MPQSSKPKMTLKGYEHTKQDQKADRKEAKKNHEIVSKWEKSKEDARMDRAAVKKINKSRKA